MTKPSVFVLLVILLSLPVDVAFSQDSDTAAPGAAEPSSYQVYTIASGDTLFSIARKFNTSVELLKSVNGIAEASQIVAGRNILVPAAPESLVGVYEIQPGDTLFGISKLFNTSPEVLQALNSISDIRQIRAGQRIVVPAIDDAELEFYVVKPEDSLYSISKRYNTAITELMSLNGIADEKQLEQGATILVPRIDETEFEVYEIVADDSLYSIARRYATTESDLMSLNGIADKRDIEAGRTILVPRVDESKYVVYEVASGDTLFSVARFYNTTVPQLRALNGIAGRLDLEAGAIILVPKVDESIFERHIVEAGDSLYSIANRYGTSITALQALNQLADTRDIKVGQGILAPKLDGVDLELYVIQHGDTLEDIADAFETTVELLQALNGITDPSLIVLDKSILVPRPIDVGVRSGFGFGLQVFSDSDNTADLATQVTQLGVNWVKVDVRWAEIESEKGVFDYSELDKMVSALELANVNIMLNIYDAPAWSRAAYVEHMNSQFADYGGPPEDRVDFGLFLANLVTRYAGLVDAYEIWKSPNLLKFWNVPVYHRAPELDENGEYGIPDEIQIGAAYYVDLLEIAYNTIKSYDDSALVITAGLAPVGYSDEYNSVATDAYLSNMLLLGAADFSDGIGAIFSASAVPPTLSCCEKPPGVDSHYESFIQYFKELLAFYHEALETYELADTPVYVTQLGWGTREGANLAVPSSGYEWLQYTSEDEQALYVTQAYNLAQNLDYVAAMFLYNLNGCAVGDEEACFFSMVDAAGVRRPVYASYAEVPKSAAA